jgi:hypothetical protein
MSYGDLSTFTWNLTPDLGNRIRCKEYSEQRRFYGLHISGLHLVATIDADAFQRMKRDIMSEYAHKVTVEATGPEGLYQRITFEQFYDESSAQIAEQERLFLSVANAVMETAKQMRDDNVKVEVRR